MDSVFDGWGTAVVFGIIWGLVFHVMTVVQPMKIKWRSQVHLLFLELSYNLDVLAEGTPVPCSRSFFEQMGPSVLAKVDDEVREGLFLLYSVLSLLRSESDLNASRDVLEQGLTPLLSGRSPFSADQRKILEKKWFAIRHAKAS